MKWSQHRFCFELRCVSFLPQLMLIYEGNGNGRCFFYHFFAHFAIQLSIHVSFHLCWFCYYIPCSSIKNLTGENSINFQVTQWKRAAVFYAKSSFQQHHCVFFLFKLTSSERFCLQSDVVSAFTYVFLRLWFTLIVWLAMESISFAWLKNCLPFVLSSIPFRCHTLRIFRNFFWNDKLVGRRMKSTFRRQFKYRHTPFIHHIPPILQVNAR